jgi:hypothetical protein
VSKVIARFELVRLMRPVHGAHYLVIRIHSSARTAKIRIKLVVGHQVRTMVVRIATNRLVKIKVGSAVTQIKGVSLLK